MRRGMQEMNWGMMGGETIARRDHRAFGGAKSGPASEKPYLRAFAGCSVLGQGITRRQLSTSSSAGRSIESLPRLKAIVALAYSIHFEPFSLHRWYYHLRLRG